MRCSISPACASWARSCRPASPRPPSPARPRQANAKPASTRTATAQAIYGTLAVGAVTAALTLVSGPLYGRFGGGGFALMAGLCAIALPIAWSLRR